MMTTMNLTRDPWIPIVRLDGAFALVSLREIFEPGSAIRRLSVRPHEKIALMRLLLCISQAALDGPADREAWATCSEKLPAAARDYLKKWEASFELFGDGPRFLQVGNLKRTPKPEKKKSSKAIKPEAMEEKEEGNPASKLDLALASGNNATLFDNRAGGDRALPNDRLALGLLTFQCFSPGGCIGVAQWKGKDSPGKGSSNHAPCTPSGMLHTYLEGENLLTTLHLNILARDEYFGTGGTPWGKPIWEQSVESPADHSAIENATTTYLGRLVSMSRAIRLNPGGRDMILANGIEYPLYPAYRETAATYVMRQDESVVLGASLGRSLWRQLSAITVKRRAESSNAVGPLALANLPDHENITLWIGALATDKGKIEDTVEGSYDIPAGMFQEAGRKLFEEGVQLAETWQQGLSFSVKTWAAAMKLEPVPYDCARRYFWTAIEQGVPTLLTLASSPETAGDLTSSAWGHAVKAAAIEAYMFACSHQTPRQIEAFARGRQQLHLRPPGAGKPAKKSAKSRKNPTYEL
jgi:CRISPR system Cascade subunit CasA